MCYMNKSSNTALCVSLARAIFVPIYLGWCDAIGCCIQHTLVRAIAIRIIPLARAHAKSSRTIRSRQCIPSAARQKNDVFT